MPTGATSIAGSPPMSIGACPTISLLTRSIRPLAFDTMRPVASSTRSAYVSILPRLVFCARVAVVRAAGGFARARDVAGRRCVRRWAARDRRVGRSGRRSLLGARRERRGFECRRSRRRGRIRGIRSERLLEGGDRMSATMTAPAAPTTRRGRASRQRLKLRIFSNRARSSSGSVRRRAVIGAAGTMANPFVLTSRSTCGF